MERLLRHTPYSGIATHDDTLIRGTKAVVGLSFRCRTASGVGRSGSWPTRATTSWGACPTAPTGHLRERKENVAFVLKALLFTSYWSVGITSSSSTSTRWGAVSA